jgi:N-methylhydantoinase A/oxoprolinase/acetone carboxylase beta subunit
LARLRASYPVAGREPEAAPLGGDDASAARAGHRPVRWNGQAVETPVYTWERLQPGHRVPGPAVLESAHTTYLIGPAWQLHKDEFGNGQLTRQE